MSRSPPPLLSPFLPTALSALEGAPTSIDAVAYMLPTDIAAYKNAVKAYKLPLFAAWRKTRQR